ncbi:RNA-binding effector protein [Grosmannia clavigera kw1407]|uniref:RNA-binding effector protein n=1 Tax=Grosmannia clavigera (strain kw1407 / UAMH 11150) TaxID=655863 RepID=F0XLV7_GROCL|nr:RNA-binding effector protein [Grosmannia clavigera kw1407]EFX01085.1 RNA-binding effector protein [Grosmannia clavigera kw1407]
MASSAPAASDLGSEASAAQRLLQKHQVTVEEVPDEDDLKHDAAVSTLAATEADGSAAKPAAADGPVPSWAPTPSTKAAGKQKEAEPVAMPKLDTQSHELFPELGAPKKAAVNVAPIWSAKNGAVANGNGTATGASNGSARSSMPSTRAGTPANANGAGSPNGPPSLSIPGRNVTTVFLDDSQILPRGALKRPIPDIIKDINRKSRANVTMAPPSGGRRRFDATGPPDVAQQALKDLIQQIGAKVTVNVPIPQSVRPFIIGKQGATIKALQEKTGARIQLPKAEDVAASALDDDDDALIDVTVEGNTLSARAAHDAILKIVGERTANVSTRLRGIPAEFYPFIADPRNGLLAQLENNGVQVRVPPLQPWSAQPPAAPVAGSRPVFVPAANDNHIQLAGDRLAVQNARADIEKLAEQLRQQLELQQTAIPKGRQQFIIGNHGTPMDEFFNETGCAIVLPTDEEDDTVTIIGPADQVNAGLDRAIDLAMGMQCSNYDISRFHRQVPGSATAHARNVTRYLRERLEIERLEKEYQAHINTPFTSEGALPWELYSRDGKNAFRAQSEIKNIVTGHPPSRMATVPVDPFFHQFLRNDVRPRLQQEHGVFLVVPDASEPAAPLLLVYEGPSGGSAEPYAVPQTAPSAEQLALFQQGVRDAQKHILDLIGAQEDIQAVSIDVPLKYHDRLRRFIKQQQEKRQANQPPVRVSNLGSVVTLRGPKTAVEGLAAKVNAFVEQEKEDEKERGFTLSFDFPKAYANHLIGKGGSNIRDLRDKYDVEIQVQDGKVELKGPKAKAEAAKAHINAVARQLADEVTHVLKIEPKFHRELIGAQGSTINRLQTRYKVLIFFPRVAKSTRDDDSATDVASEAGKGRRQQGPDEVIVRGPKRGADEAREELMTLFLYLKDNAYTATLSVQQKQVPYLIGQGGSAMDALRQQTGAKIDIPNSRGDPESIVEIQIKGTKTQVAAAKKFLEEKKAVLDDTVTKTIEVEKKYHKALIGTGGSGSTIKVEGRKAVVDAIVAQIEAFVNERASQISSVLDVPRDKHRALIGRGGETRRQMEAKFSVTVDIPRQGEDRTEIKVTGLPANVEKAKEHIQSLVREQHSVTVQVPRRVHHAVSNNGQFFRRMRNENQVTVDHAGQAIPPRPTGPTAAMPVNGSGTVPLITDDEEAAAGAHSWRVVEATSSEEGDIPWVLHGSPENVEEAQRALAKAIEQQGQGGGATGYLLLPDPSVFRHIVGHGGKKIESIRKQSGCRIHVPQGRAGNEPIEVVGSKEGVEVAKDLILAAVTEGAKKPE